MVGLELAADYRVAAPLFILRCLTNNIMHKKLKQLTKSTKTNTQSRTEGELSFTLIGGLYLYIGCAETSVCGLKLFLSVHCAEL